MHDIVGTEYRTKKTKRDVTYNSLDEIVSQLNNVTAVHKYHYEGKLVSAVIRSESNNRKTFTQTSFEGKWRKKAPLKPTLYMYDKIKDLDRIVVVEGEKACDALWMYGIPATTSSGGANGAKKTDWSVIKDKKLILWPDNDDAGRKYMEQVKSLSEAEVKWCEPDLPKKGDAYDFIAELKQRTSQESLIRQAVIDCLADSKKKDAVEGLKSLIHGCIDGTNVAVDFPDDSLTRLTQALLPGTVTLLCGDPGASKSFMLLSWLAYWSVAGVEASAFLLEDAKEEVHLLRLLAMMSGQPEMTDRNWINKNPAESLKAYSELEAQLGILDKMIDDAPDNQESLDSLIQWMERKALHSRILCIDPITAASVGKKNQWEADSEFMLKCKSIARQHSVSIILVTHPKTGINKQYSLESLAGGAAYPRFSHTVLWLETHDAKEEEFRCFLGGTSINTINRTLHMMKARNGKGQGLQVGYMFESLQFTDRGLVVKEKK